MKKQRIDLLLVEKALFPSREKARSALMAGLVHVDGVPVDKAGTKVDPNADIRVKGPVSPYVSRGGLKLEKAIREFSIVLHDQICLDIGASTGGFTDCMLQHGARKVYAIDVGYGQLSWKLRNDDRVVVMDRTNIRRVVPDDLADMADFASVDVSFISLKIVVPVVLKLLTARASMVLLIKPQFEAGRERVGKNGVVRDPGVHKQVLREIVDMCDELDLQVLGLSFSPIKGPKGNVEFLLYVQKGLTGDSSSDPGMIGEVVETSKLHQF